MTAQSRSPKQRLTQASKDAGGPRLTVGDRVDLLTSLDSDGNPKESGVLRFLDSTRFAPGSWAGVELDKPIGKNDGSVEGVRYFECAPFCGIFVQPKYLRLQSPPTPAAANSSTVGGGDAPPDPMNDGVPAKQKPAVCSPVRDAFADRVREVVAIVGEGMWKPQGLIGALVHHFREDLAKSLPENLTADRSQGFDLKGGLEKHFETMVALIRQSATQLEEQFIPNLQQALVEDTSDLKSDQLRGAMDKLVSELNSSLRARVSGNDSGLEAGLRSALGVSQSCGLDAAPWVKIEQPSRGRPPFIAHLDVDQVIARCLLLLHHLLDSALAGLGDSVGDVCASLPEGLWEEPCLRDAFGENAAHRKPPAEKLGRGGNTAKARAAKPRQKLPQDEAEAAFERLKQFIHRRASSAFNNQALGTILGQMVQGFGGDFDPTSWPPDQCLPWQGPTFHQGSQACVRFAKPGETEVSDGFATRLLVFLFADDHFYNSLSELPGRGAFTMACGNQLCVNLAHIAGPATGLEEKSVAKGADRGGNAAKARAARPRQKLTQEEAEVALERLGQLLHQRASSAFSNQALGSILVQMVQGFGGDINPVMFPPDQCLPWQGLTSPDGTQACLRFAKPGETEVSDGFATRLLVFCFAGDDLFKSLNKVPSRDAYTMTCGNQLCVNMAHIACPAAGSEDKSRGRRGQAVPKRPGR